MDRLRLFVLAALVSCLGAFGCVSNGGGTSDAEGSANSPETSQPDATQSTAEAENVSEQQLVEFARLSQQIHQIRQTTKKQIEAAESEQEAKQLQQDALRRIQSLFDDSDMTEEEYQRIGRQLQNNPDLRRRLKQKLEGQQKGGT